MNSNSHWITVILCYDHMLSFSWEVTYIWTAGFRRSSLWFILVRYFALISTMAMVTLTFTPFDSMVPPLESGARDPDRGTLVMRVVALYSFDKRVVFTGLTAAAVAIFALTTWFVIPRGPPPTYETSLPGCHTPVSRAQNIRELHVFPPRTLGGDIILLGLALYNGYIRSRSHILRTGSLWRVLVRDGTMYFGLICLANLAHILMYYFGDINTSSSLTSFAVALSVTMICRIMLNLHDTAAVRPIFVTL
ncbi:hypothetical protein DFH09DRAFT_1401945 [Mycena vulgaris]|nr:hypothetical protein DFH09DRAFT_1401945 [Mycena vulgaris]